MSRSILGHARQRLGRIYTPNRPLKEQRDGLQWWSAELIRLLGAPKGEPARRKDKAMGADSARTSRDRIPAMPR